MAQLPAVASWSLWGYQLELCSRFTGWVCSCVLSAVLSA